MLIKTIKPHEIKSSEITTEKLYHQRRQFIKQGIGLATAAAVPSLVRAETSQAEALASLKPLDAKKMSQYSVDEAPNSYKDIVTYNNYYEFGTSKSAPAKNAHTLVTDPWSITIDGECEKPGTLGLEDFLKPHTLEERIYRFRCVETWSMIVPWIGFSLADALQRFKPTSKAKYIAFETLADKSQMPGLWRPVLDWPYKEGLRIDEAMHPLTMLVTGLYGKELPNQNGAPLRLIVPWKYGFKSIKSIVRISFRENQPSTAWNLSAPQEYGFYSNVNPEVRHPRWSQAKERRLGELFKKPTLPFNGYADEVAGLYTGMDLTKNF